jgi:RNA polymerase sigma-70 factor (ECF subfamily)
MRDAAFSEVECLAALAEADRTFPMTEEAFRAFYEQTARSVWGYLARATGDSRLADDLLQETYYRFLRARARLESNDHRRHYLFRIATNLVRDHRRGRRVDPQRPGAPIGDPVQPGSDPADRAARRIDLSRAMGRMTARERSLLWLAYAQGLSHEELAGVLGVRKASLKVLLFRARRRLLGLLTSADGAVEKEKT